MGLLTIILAMLAHFTTLFLRLPWPIYFFVTSFYSHGFVAKFLGLLWLFYYVFISHYSYGLIDHHSYLGSFGHPQPIYFFFTSCYFYEPIGYQSFHFSPLVLFPYFFTVLPLVFFSSSLLLGFFFCWAVYWKWASTFSPLTIWIALAIHMRILMQYSFAGF